MADEKNPIDDVPMWALLPTEWLCGITSASLMAPFIAVIDTSISANAGGVKPLKQALADGFRMMFKEPAKFLKWRPFQYVFLCLFLQLVLLELYFCFPLLNWFLIYSIILGVYGCTYFVANTTIAVCERLKQNPFYYKFGLTSLTNVSASVYKEMEFTRMYSLSKPRPLPIPSALLFCGRDSLTILASFNLPTIMAKKLHNQFHVNMRAADIVSQLTLPCAVQLLSAPLYLVGSHLYNFPTAPMGERVAFVQHKYWATSAARVARIFPAFGVGGVANSLLRQYTRGKLVQVTALPLLCVRG